MGTMRERAVDLVDTWHGDKMATDAMAQKILEVVVPFELDASRAWVLDLMVPQ